MPASGGESVLNSESRGGNMTFGEIAFDEPGQYTYQITESNNTSDGRALPGVTNDSESTKTVVVTVTASNTVIEGKNVRILSATLPTTTFINKYSAAQVSASVPVKKMLDSTTGFKPDIAGKYTFYLATTDPDMPMPEGTQTLSDGTRYVTVTNPDSDGGTASFPAITFTKEGTYDYAVRETGKVAGVTNDANPVRRVSIVVADDTKGNLYIDDAKSIGLSEPTTFTNKYSVSSVMGSITLKKTLACDAGLTPPDISNAYTFRITALTDGAPMLDGAGTGTDDDGHRYVTVTNPDKDGGTISVNNLAFTREGTYRYKVEETGSKAGVENDSTPVRYIQFVVTDEHDGTLSVKIQTTDADGGNATDVSDNTVEFVNTYSVKGVTINASVRKTLSVPSGFTAPDVTGKFTFTLSASGDVPMPEGSQTSSQGVTAKAVVNPDADGGTASFGDITFTKPGTYKYGISENSDNSLNDIIQNDAANPKIATATVTDNSDGTLRVVVTSTYKDVLGNDTTVTLYDSKTSESAEPVSFTNTYKLPDPVTCIIPVTKEIDRPAGSNPESIKNDFTFSIEADSAGAPMPAENTSITNPDDEGGTAEFGAISFTSPGTYRYKITESNTDPANPPEGFTEDENNPKYVTVVVTDNKNGSMNAKLYGADTVWNSDGTVKEEYSSTTFINKYDTSAVLVNIPVTKAIDSAEGTSHQDATGLFSFTLTAGRNDAGVETPMPSGEGNVAYNPDSDGGTAYFGSITYSKVGVYHYTIKENDTDTETGGFTYDKSEKEVIVTVSDNGQGQLVAEIQGADSTTDKTVSSTTFTNSYTSKGTYGFTAAKKLNALNGTTGPDITNKFRFTLTADDASNPMPSGSITASDGTVSKTVEGPNEAGYVVFGSAEFTKEGEYSYTIRESGGSLPGVENDTAEKKITLSVKDGGMGKMNITVKDGSDKPAFENTYAAEGTAEISVSKKLSGVPSGAAVDISSKYRFTLTADEGTPLPETTSYTNPDSDGGTVKFSGIKYTSPGQYTYTITESNEGDAVPGVTNDANSSRTVVVKVTDNKDGTLMTRVTGDTTFTNVYKADPVNVSIPVRKGIDNPQNVILPDFTGDFTFTLTGEDNAPLPEVTVLTNPMERGGDLTFGSIEFTEAGTYTYKIKETSTKEEATTAVIFDSEPERTVTVVVTDDGSGRLSAAVYEGSAETGSEITAESPLTFNNTFSPAVIQVRAYKTLLGRNMMPGEKFTFRIEPGDESTLESLRDDQIALTDGTTPANYLETTVSNLTDGHKTVFSFGSAIFREPGDYYFKVTEVVPADADKKPNVTYDSSEQYLKITVTQNADKTLTAAASTVVKGSDGSWSDDTDGTGFVNKYIVSTVSEKPWISKIARSSPDDTGVAVPFNAGDFTFTAYYKKGELENTPVSSVTNPDDSADGSDRFEFNHIEFFTADAPAGEFTLQELVDKGTAEKTVTADGVTTYKIDYIIKETEEPDQYTTNDQGYSFQMVVTDDGKGNLTVAQDPDYDFEFDNYLKSAAVRVTLDGRKTLSGRELKQGEVTFRLEPADNANPMPSEGTETDADGKKYKTSTNVVGGEVHFGNIVFTQDNMVGVPVNGYRDFKYTVSEAPTTAGSMPNVTFQDPEEFTIRVFKKIKEGSTSDFVLDYEILDKDGNKVKTAFIFENVYTPEPATATIKAYKALETTNSAGLTWKSFSGKFSFILEAANNDAGVQTPMPENGVKTDEDGDRYVVVTLTDTSANGAPLTEPACVEFDSIKFEKPGIYNYLITETGNSGGVTNDRDTERRIAVRVTDDPSTGRLSAKVYNENGIPESEDVSSRTTFTNKYATAPATAVITVTKKLSVPEGTNGPSDIAGKFTFTLRPSTNTAEGSIETPMPEGSPSDSEGVYATVTNPDKDGGTASYGSIKFEKPGVYTYTISESGTADGILNDSEKTVTVTVTDLGNGKLKADVTEQATFTNSYSVKPVSAELTVTCALKSSTPRIELLNIKDQYTYTIGTATRGPSAPMPEKTVIKNTSDSADENGRGTYSFGNVEFTAPGTYVYLITQSGNIPGVVNDAETSKKVKVIVSDNGDGTMHAEVLGADTEYDNAAAVKTPRATTTFTNTMKPVVLAAQASINGTQTLIGRDMHEGEKFLYILEPKDDVTKEAVTNKNIELNGGGVSSLTASVVSAKDESPATFVFDRVVFKTPGMYTFSMHQETESVSTNGMTFDEKSYEVKVVVTANDDGSLSYTIDGNTPSFVNKYHSSGMHLLIPEKSLEGQPIADEGDTSENGGSGEPDGSGETSGEAPEHTFEFVVEYAQGSMQGQTAASGSVTMKLGDEAKTAPIILNFSNDGQGGTINLKDLVAKKTATAYDGIAPSGEQAKYYSVQLIMREKRPTDGTADAAIEYASNSFSFIVTLEDAGDGQLTSYTSGLGDLKDLRFVNYYKSNIAHLSFSGVKALTGGASLKGDDFEFTLTGKDGAPMPEGSENGTKTVRNDAGGGVDFGEIDFDVNDLGGAASKTFTYIVSESGSMPGVKNDSEMEKTVKVTVSDDGKGVLTLATDPAEATLFTFTNDYVSTPGERSVSDDIEITKVITGRELEDGEFRFELKDAAGNKVAEAKNTADGKVIFPAIKFDNPGVYTYTVEEANDSAQWVTYDETKYFVTATVTENYDGKPMTVKWTTGTDKPVTFENTYHDLTTQSIAAAVAWKADDDHLADRPDSVTITLFANGAPFRTATVSAADGWRCTFDDLLIYGDGNEKITYTVDETTVPDKYEKSVSGDAERGFVITNTRKADPPASAEPSENGGSSVNTGDTGTIAGWLLLMACSLLTALTAAREKHRK